MAIFADQIQRLLRVDWNKRGGAQALAQEIAAIFRSDSPITITSPLTLGPSGDNSPLTIITNTLPGGAIPDPISYIFNATPTVPGSPPVPPTPPVPPSPPSAASGVFSARVDSQDSGVNYNCTLFPGSFSAVVEMKNLATGAPGADLVGAWVVAIDVGGGAYHGFPTTLYG